MKRREFIIKSASAGIFLSASRIFPSLTKTQNPQVGNALRFPPVLQPGENLVLQTTNVEVKNMHSRETNAFQNFLENGMHNHFEINNVTLKFKCRVCKEVNFIYYKS